MSLAEELAPYRRASDFSARRLAEFAGVAASTVTRIEKGQMQPSFDVARELLTLVGSPLLQATTNIVDAIAVAKKAVEGVVAPTTDGMREWLMRWQRGGLLDGDGRVASRRARDELLTRTARVTRVPSRPSLRTIPQRSWKDAIAALESAGVDYVLSGSPAANMWVSSAPDSEAVFYVSDLDSAEAALWEASTSEGAQGVFVLPFDGVSERNSQSIEGIYVASVAQTVIDCLGLPGRQPAQAEAIMDNWELSQY